MLKCVFLTYLIRLPLQMIVYGNDLWFKCSVVYYSKGYCSVWVWPFCKLGLLEFMEINEERGQWGRNCWDSRETFCFGKRKNWGEEKWRRWESTPVSSELFLSLHLKSKWGMIICFPCAQFWAINLTSNGTSLNRSACCLKQ